MDALKHCRHLLVQVDAAAGDRAALAAAHLALIGHDPFADEPGADLGEELDVLRDFVREVADSFGVRWADVDPLAGAPEPAGWRLDC